MRQYLKYGRLLNNAVLAWAVVDLGIGIVQTVRGDSDGAIGHFIATLSGVLIYVGVRVLYDIVEKWDDWF